MKTEAPFWKRITGGLSRTASRLGNGITSLGKRKLDRETLAALEDLLIGADVGTETSAAIIAAIRNLRIDRELDDDEIKELLAAEIEKTSLLFKNLFRSTCQKNLLLP